MVIQQFCDFLIVNLDIATHPDFEKNNLIYVTYSKNIGEKSTTQLSRLRWDKKNKLFDFFSIFIDTFFKINKYQINELFFRNWTKNRPFHSSYP